MSSTYEGYELDPASLRIARQALRDNPSRGDVTEVRELMSYAKFLGCLDNADPLVAVAYLEGFLMAVKISEKNPKETLARGDKGM